MDTYFDVLEEADGFLNGYCQDFMLGDMLYVAITGSHSWGLQTEQSDLDLRGIYGQDIQQILSMCPGRDNQEGSVGIIDFQFYELKKALKMLCASNGNVVELLHNPLVVKTSPIGQELMGLARLCKTKRLSNYYRGYATSQRKRAMQNRGGKALVYTYREIYSGIWLMQTGDIVFDFETLRNHIENQYVSKVLPWAMDNRFTPTPAKVTRQFDAEWEDLTELLDRAVSVSELPDDLPVDFEEKCNEILWNYRMGCSCLTCAHRQVQGDVTHWYGCEYGNQACEHWEKRDG